jgi:hypothetical protein
MVLNKSSRETLLCIRLFESFLFFLCVWIAIAALFLFLSPEAVEIHRLPLLIQDFPLNWSKIAGLYSWKLSISLLWGLLLLICGLTYINGFFQLSVVEALCGRTWMTQNKKINLLTRVAFLTLGILAFLYGLTVIMIVVFKISGKNSSLLILIPDLLRMEKFLSGIGISTSSFEFHFSLNLMKVALSFAIALFIFSLAGYLEYLYARKKGYPYKEYFIYGKLLRYMRENREDVSPPSS